MTEDEIDQFFEKVKAELKKVYPDKKIFVPKPDPKNGKKNVDILFLNERPGRSGTKKSGCVSFDNEDPSARMFKELFESLEISRKKIYITNACLWIPDEKDFRDRYITKKELGQKYFEERLRGKKYFEEQLRIMDPKLIVAVGNSAIKALKIIFSDSKELKNYKLGKNIGEVTKDSKPWIYPIYHTAMRVRNSKLRTSEQQKEDWLKIKEILKEIIS